MADPVMTQVLPEERTYDVELHTVLGRRSGQMKLFLSGESFSGILRLMGFENSLSGHTLSDGTCHMTGCIRTRMGRCPFEGKGTLLRDQVEAQLRCKGVSLSLRGSRKEE